jgi:hypothetical protein
MSGTINNPADLYTALQSARVIPGDTLLLRGGTYELTLNYPWNATIQGDAAHPITIKSYPGETAIIEGEVNMSGDYVIWRDLVFRNSKWTSRLTTQSGSEPTDMPVEKKVEMLGDHVSVINCVLHDLSGFYSYGVAGSLIYGNVIFHMGWSGADRGHCHGLYTANDGTTQIIVKDNIVFENFATGLKLYGTQAALDNYLAEGNTSFQNGVPHGLDGGPGGAHVLWNLLAGDVTHVGERIIWKDNMTYFIVDLVAYGRPTLGTNALSWGTYGLDGATITGNYLAGREVDFRGTAAGPITNSTVTGNKFVGPASRLQTLFPDGGDYIAWGAAPDTYFVRPNEYDNTRANVTVYNWSLANSVTVDLSTVTGLAVGDSVTVRNVQDYFNDTQSLTIDANKRISVDMRAVSHTVVAPYQWTAAANCFPEFGAFVVKKS